MIVREIFLIVTEFVMGILSLMNVEYVMEMGILLAGMERRLVLLKTAQQRKDALILQHVIIVIIVFLSLINVFIQTIVIIVRTTTIIKTFL